MIYTIDITTPKNTSILNPLRSVLKVTYGFVYKVEFDFPPGPKGLLHVVVFDGGFQLWPHSRGLTFHANNYCISFDDSYFKSSPPYEFEVYTWNNDDTFDHAIQIRVGLVTEKMYIQRFLPHMAIDELKAYFEELEAKRQEEKAVALESPFPWITPEETGLGE